MKKVFQIVCDQFNIEIKAQKQNEIFKTILLNSKEEKLFEHFIVFSGNFCVQRYCFIYLIYWRPSLFVFHFLLSPLFKIDSSSHLVLPTSFSYCIYSTYTVPYTLCIQMIII